MIVDHLRVNSRNIFADIIIIVCLIILNQCAVFRKPNEREVLINYGLINFLVYSNISRTLIHIRNGL